MDKLPVLTESDIRDWSDSRSFSRGRGYYQNGAILHPRRAEMTLKAECRGSSPQPYRVEVTLNSRGIESGSCSCPVGYGGTCKHGVALLLTWLHKPETFSEVVEQKRALEERSKEELIYLIGKMLERHPGLETLLEMPIPQAGGDVAPIDPDVIRRQVQETLESSYDEYGWRHGYGDFVDLSFVIGQGEAYEKAADWENAAVVYETVARQILDSYEELYDEEGEYLSFVNSCAAGLQSCLTHIDDPAIRMHLLEALFYIDRWDTNYGGVGAGDEAHSALVEETTPEEKAQIAQWIQAELAQTGDGFTGKWRRQVYGGFLLGLQQDEMDDETFLAVCRETDRILDLIQRLLELDRLDEAVAEARTASDWDLTQMADIFRAAGYGDVVAEVIAQRPPDSKDLRPVEWLLDYRRETGDLADALAIAQRIFARRSRVHEFKVVRDIAEELGVLEEVVGPIIRHLAEKKEYILLTQIYINEKEVDLALDALAQAEENQDRRFYLSGASLAQLRLQVAALAEKERPNAAISLYLRAAEDLLQARGRGNYHTAAEYLQRIGAIYRQSNRAQEFEALVLRLREENSRLRAMQDEFNKAGLPGAKK